MDYTLLLIGHGSRDGDGVDEFLELSRLVNDRRKPSATAIAFLEFEPPTIAESIEQLAERGVRQVVVQPAMLFASGHVRVDIPRALNDAVLLWPQLQFILADPFGDDANLMELCRVRWDEARSIKRAAASETALLVVGRGSTDPVANSQLDQIAAQLRVDYGVACARVAYSGLARPTVPAALEQLAADRFRSVVVQPFLLFDGVLVKQIHADVAAAASIHPDLHFTSVQHLGVHELLADAIQSHADAAARSKSEIRSTKSETERS